MLQVNTTAMTDARPLSAKSRTSASLDGFRSERKTCPRRPPTTLVSRICPCGSNKRPFGRLSSRTRELVHVGRPFAIHGTVGRFRTQPWRSCPRRTPRPLRIRPPRACRIASGPHFFRNGSFTDRWSAPVSPVTRIQSPIKGNLQKNAFLQNQ